MLHLALYQPAIAGNVGSVARTCVGLDIPLHLIGPHRLDYSQHAVRRAGLDYWPHLALTLHDSPDAFLHWLDGRTPWLLTRHADRRVDHAPYRHGDILLCGNENTGLPHAWHARWPDRRLALPSPGRVRSYNLANAATAAAVVAYCRLHPTPDAGAATTPPDADPPPPSR